MSVGIQLILSTALVAAAPGCSWTHPGANPYRGDPARALAGFDLPEDTRRKLRAMLHSHQPTDVVAITRDDIVGDHRYAGLRDMHSGGGRVCHGSVDRSAWSTRHSERALVYCADEACIIVPTICNNVSLVSRKPDDVAANDDSPIDIEPAAGPPAGGGPTESPLAFAPPLDTLSPPDILGALPGAPDLPGGGVAPPSGGGPTAGGGPDGGGPIGGAPVEGGPIDGGPGPIGGIPIGGIVPPCCDLPPTGPGAPGSPPVPPPVAVVPEPPSPWFMLAGCALLGLVSRRARRNPAFRPIGTVMSIK